MIQHGPIHRWDPGKDGHTVALHDRQGSVRIETGQKRQRRLVVEARIHLDRLAKGME